MRRYIILVLLVVHYSMRERERERESTPPNCLVCLGYPKTHSICEKEIGKHIYRQHARSGKETQFSKILQSIPMI